MASITVPTIQDQDINFRINGNTLSELECTSNVNEKKNKKKRKKLGKKKQSAPKKKNSQNDEYDIKKHPFEGQKICFDVSGPFGSKLLHHFLVNKFPKESIQVKEGKSYLFGVNGDSVIKEKNLYQVNWNFTVLKAMNMPGTYILSEVVLANDI
eukprot:2422294-Ditylum_brightwellii.AAC.1